MRTLYQAKMAGKYQAVLFHPEGDYVSDFHYSDTKQQVWDSICDMGSRWILYPIPFVTTEKTVVDAPDGLEWMKGKRIKTVAKYLNQQWVKRADDICNLINNGAPLHHIY